MIDGIKKEGAKGNVYNKWKKTRTIVEGKSLEQTQGWGFFERGGYQALFSEVIGEVRNF